MLGLFHFLMFVFFLGFGAEAFDAVDGGDWVRAAIFAGLAAATIGVELFAARFLPWFLGRNPYEDGPPRGPG